MYFVTGAQQLLQEQSDTLKASAKILTKGFKKGASQKRRKGKKVPFTLQTSQ